MPLLSMMAFLGCAVLAFHNLFAPDRGGARVAYIWLSLPGTLVAAFAIGQLFFYDPGSISNPITAWFILLYAIYNPGWMVFPTVLVSNLVSRSSGPGDGFSLLMCCLLMALWLWGYSIDNFVLPALYAAF